MNLSKHKPMSKKPAVTDLYITIHYKNQKIIQQDPNKKIKWSQHIMVRYIPLTKEEQRREDNTKERIRIINENLKIFAEKKRISDINKKKEEEEDVMKMSLTHNLFNNFDFTKEADSIESDSDSDSDSESDSDSDF